MSDAGRGVLITRPEPGASDTAAQVARLGLQPIVAPLLQISPLRTPLPPSSSIQAVLVSSANAVPALPLSHRHLPLFAVGAATAARARAAGFERVTSADGDAQALATVVADNCDPQDEPLLLVTGRSQGRVLTTALRNRGFRVVRRVVYAARPVPSLPIAAREALEAKRLDAAMFFSAATARHCVQLLIDARLHEAVRSVDALAIGPAAAMALEALPWRRIRVADRPNQDAMLALLR